MSAFTTEPPPLDLSGLVTPEPWNQVAFAYAEFIAGVLGRYAQDALQWAEVKPGERVLDVATGPGTLAIQAARITEVDALDFSQEMLDELARRAEPETTSRLRWHCGDGQALPFSDASFDAGFSMFGLFMFPDRARGLSELARVVRPGGRVVIGSWQPQNEIPAFSIVLSELKTLMAPDFVPPPPPLADRASLESEMSAAGFEVEVKAFTHQMQTPSLDALFDRLRQSHVALKIAEKQLDEARFDALMASIRSRFERELGTGPQQVVMPAWLGLGRRPK